MAQKAVTAQEKFFFRAIETHRTRMEATRKGWMKYVQAYRSRFHSGNVPTLSTQSQAGEDDVTVESNYLFAFVDSLISNICPPNPEVDVVPRRRALKNAASFRTKLVNDFLMRTNAAQKLWKLAARACVYPRAFIKVVWNARKGRPDMRVLSPQWVFYDSTAETWEDIRYIIEVTVLTRGDIEARVKTKGSKKQQYYRSDTLDPEADGGAVTFNSYPDWLKADEANKGEPDEEDVAREAYEWAVVYEVYDLVGKKFYHFAEGVERALFAGELPYQHQDNPFYMLAFNDNLEDLGGLSDAALVYPTVERLNEMSTLQMWHLKTSIPVPVVHEGLVDDPDEFLDAYEDVDGPGQALIMNAKPHVGINDVLGYTPTSQLPVNWSSAMGELTQLIEFVLGLPAYQRGELGQSDVATELALADTAQRTRNLRRQKALYLALAWVAEAVVSLYAEFMPQDSSIPLRLSDGGPDVRLDRNMLAFPDADGEGNLPPKDAWGFDYDARPFNADEMNSVVALKKLETFLPLLQGNPNVDQRKLTQKLAELLKMPEILASEEQASAAEQAMAGGPPGGPAPGGDAGVPPGVPPEMAGLLQGGVVEAGTGSGGVPAQEMGAPIA